MRPLSTAAVLLGLWSGLAATSPRQNVEPPPISIKSDLVTLTVTVVDDDGALVGGLRREHFTVFDDGAPTDIQFFTSEDVPATIGLVIDSSGSMRAHRADVTAAAAAFAAMRHPLDQFFTVNFNDEVWPGLPPPLLFTDDTAQLLAALGAAPARGMSAVYDALDAALTHVQLGTRDRKALILVSDGGDNASAQTLDVVLDRARRAGAPIYGVAIFDADDREARPKVIKKLARDSGGRLFVPGRPEEVTSAFVQIAEEIRSVYTIGFQPVDVPGGGFRTIRVTADAGDGRTLIARTRAGYEAGAAEQENR